MIGYVCQCLLPWNDRLDVELSGTRGIVLKQPLDNRPVAGNETLEKFGLLQNDSFRRQFMHTRA